MKVMKKRAVHVVVGSLFAASGVAVMPGAVLAQESAPAAQSAPAQPQELNEIVVTASGGDKTRMQSSISVADVDSAKIEDFTPRSEAEVLRMIPGLNLQDTAGPGGNSNIGVRGIPVSTGGSEYVALQEDGLPVVLFGDIQFGNNDYWLRFDSNVDRVEAVRGGSTSTYASQAPGAVINYISKTGEQEGGSIGLSKALNFTETRVDYDYGAHITPSLRFHVGGFFKDGDGPTNIAYTAEKGYQIKANLTKDFNDGKGYFRLNFKHLDDQEPTFTSMPSLVGISGNQITGFSPLPGVDARTYSSTGLYNQSFQVLNAQGNLQTVPMQGIHVNVTSFGGEFQNELGGMFTVNDKFRLTNASGAFSNQWTGEALTSSLPGSSLNGGVVGGLQYAAGPQLGQAYTGTYLSNSAQANTTINDMGSFANDLNLTAKFHLADSQTLNVKAGWFHMRQNIVQDWRINNEIQSLNSQNNPVPLDAFTAAGAQLTANGLTGFNNQWGGCCGGRTDNLTYTDDAPSLNLDFKTGPIDIDGSVRADTVRASGQAFAPVQVGNIAVGDALTSLYQTSAVSLPAYNTSNVPSDLVNYQVSYTSWSFGGLYEIDHDTSVFARASRGGRANADRMMWSGDFNADGSLNAKGSHNAVNYITQQEVGVKNRGQFGEIRYNAEATYFMAQLTEHNYDFTKQLAVDAVYHAHGIETDGSVRWGHLVVDGSIVYLHSADTTHNLTPGAMPTVTYRFSPTYDMDLYALGLTLDGQTSSYTGDSQYVIPGNHYLNAFAKYRPFDSLEVGLNVNNLLNTLGYRGSGSLAVTGLPGNQAIFDNSAMLGRTVTASIRYRF